MNTQRRRLGVLGVAAKLDCHPRHPRLVKEKRLPPPDKLLNKNIWWEDVIDDLVEHGPPRKKKSSPNGTPPPGFGDGVCIFMTGRSWRQAVKNHKSPRVDLPPSTIPKRARQPSDRTLSLARQSKKESKL